MSTLVISRTSPLDHGALTMEELGMLGITVRGGEVCFLAVEQSQPAQDQESCFICLERAAIDVSGPCGHGGMCAVCFTRVWVAPGAKCPVCRQLLRPLRAPLSTPTS